MVKTFHNQLVVFTVLLLEPFAHAAKPLTEPYLSQICLEGVIHKLCAMRNCSIGDLRDEQALIEATNLSGSLGKQTTPTPQQTKELISIIEKYGTDRKLNSYRKRIAEEGSIVGAQHSLQESVAYFKSSATDPLAFYVHLEDKKEIRRFGASIYQRFFDPGVEVRLDPDFQSIRAWTHDSWVSTYWLGAAFATPVMMLLLPTLANSFGIGPEQSQDALENLRQNLPGTIPAFFVSLFLWKIAKTEVTGTPFGKFIERIQFPENSPKFGELTYFRLPVQLADVDGNENTYFLEFIYRKLGDGKYSLSIMSRPALVD